MFRGGKDRHIQADFRDERNSCHWRGRETGDGTNQLQLVWIRLCEPKDFGLYMISVFVELVDVLQALFELRKNEYGQCNVSYWKLFDNFDDVVNRAVAEEEKRRKTEEERLRAKEEQRKAAAEKREAERKAEEEKRKAAAEKQRLDKIAALETEKQQIEAELPHIKGLFSGGKRRDMENRLAEIERELRELKK